MVTTKEVNKFIINWIYINKNQLVLRFKKGDFYRVLLSKDDEAWIHKNSVKIAEREICPKFITMNRETYKNASKHTIEFTEKLPYTIRENDTEIVFKVYNPLVSENSIYTVNIRKPNKYTYETISYNGVYVFKVNEICR